MEWIRNDQKFQWELIDVNNSVLHFVTDEFLEMCPPSDPIWKYSRISRDLLKAIKIRDGT